jgi:hypothetical protein
MHKQRYIRRPDPAGVISPPSAKELRPLIACAAILLVGAAANLLSLLDPHALNLSGDEAFYWEWARRPALSYYEKGPLIAYIIAASRAVFADWSQRVVGSEMLAVRLPAIVLSTLTGLGIYVLALDTLRRPRVALAAVALTFAIPILAAGSILMTIDTPFACAWVWTMVLLQRALRHDQIATWLAAGLLIAAGILAKYTMVLIFPAFGLLLLIEPSLRRWLRRPGPYLALVIGLAGFVPVLVWSGRHGWVNFRHVAGQAGVAHGPSFDFTNVIAYVGGQTAVLGGVWFVGMVWALLDVWRRPCAGTTEIHDAPSARFLAIATAVPWLVFLAFSPITKIQPNWPVVALIPGTIVMALWLGRRLRLPTRAGRAGAKAFIVAGIVLGGGMVVVMHRTDWIMPVFARLARNAPPWELTPIAKYDPTARLRGWSELGAAVGEVIAAERAAGRDPFLLAEDYQSAAEIAFYTPGEPTVYSAQSALGGRMSQYDIWPNPIRDRADFVNRPCIYVGSLQPALSGEPGGRGALTAPKLARTVVHEVRGHPVQMWTIYTSDAFAGFDETAPAARRY